MATEFDQILVTSSMPEGSAARLTAAFSKLVPAKFVANNNFSEPMGMKRPESKRFYRALGNYCANEIAKEFDTPEGRDLLQNMMRVTAGEKGVLVMQGMPEDPEVKGLVIMGLKTLLADTKAPDDAGFKKVMQASLNPKGIEGDFKAFSEEAGKESVPADYYQTLAATLTSAPARKAGFHTDGMPKFEEAHLKSMLLLASREDKMFVTPTLFKRAGSPDSEAVAHAIKPDEVILCDNKTLEHTPGWVGDKTKRKILRYTVSETTLSHTSNYLQEGKTLREQGDVPADQDALRDWLVKESARLEGRINPAVRVKNAVKGMLRG